MQQCRTRIVRKHGEAALPDPPEQPLPSQGNSVDTIAAYNKAALEVYRGTMPTCTTCGRRFADEGKLAKHMITHLAAGTNSAWAGAAHTHAHTMAADTECASSDWLSCVRPSQRHPTCKPRQPCELCSL